MNKKSIFLTSVFFLASAGSSYPKIAVKSEPPVVVGDSQSNAGVTDPDSSRYISGVSETDSTDYVNRLLDDPNQKPTKPEASYDDQEDQDDALMTAHSSYDDGDDFFDPNASPEADVLDEETLKKIFQTDEPDQESTASVKMYSHNSQTSAIDGKTESIANEASVEANMSPSGKWAIEESSTTAKNGKVVKATRSKWAK
jgi:hypothetical protein